MNYFSAGRFLPVGLFTTLDLSPSVTILRWLKFYGPVQEYDVPDGSISF